MTRKSEGIRAAILIVAGTVAIASDSSLPVVAASTTKAAASTTKAAAPTPKSAASTPESDTSKPTPKSTPRSATSRTNGSAKPIPPGNLGKTDQAEAILVELQNMDHPEQKIRMGTPGWQEERQAASESSQHKLHDVQAKLSLLGSSIAPVLAEGLNSSNRDVADSCIKVLAQFGPDAIPSVISIIKKYGVIPNAVALLRQIGSDSLPPLLVMLKSSDKTESLTALTVLDSILPGPNNFRMYPRQMFSVRFNSVVTENVVFSGPQVEQICSLQTNDSSIKFKQLLASLLGKIGPRSPQVATRLVTFISHEDQPEVRQAAITALGTVVAHQNQETANESIDILLKSLAKDDYPECRSEAATALGRLPFAATKSVPVLAQALKDGYPEVVNASVQALGSLGEKASGALPDLLKLVQIAPDQSEQYQVMTAIGSMKEAALPALPYVLKFLSGNNVQLRTGALNVVVNLGPAARSAVPQLISMLPDSQVRSQVVQALGAIGPAASAAVPALRELAQSDQNDRFTARQTIQQALQKITGEAQEQSDGTQSNVTRSVVPPPVPSPVPVLRIHSRNASSI